jgi:hypothetical protein
MKWSFSLKPIERGQSNNKERQRFNNKFGKEKRRMGLGMDGGK